MHERIGAGAPWEAVGRAHGEVFADIRPATSMVQVAALIDPRMRVEVEATAVVSAGRDVTSGGRPARSG